MNGQRFLCALLLVFAARSVEASWGLFSYPAQWIREIFSSPSQEEFSRRIGELDEFFNDSRAEDSPWRNVTRTNSAESEAVALNRSHGQLLLQTNSSGLVLPVFANESDVSADDQNETEVIVEEEDNWQDYFEQLLSHDTSFCFSLLICEISARPDKFLEYGRRVARFFENYRPIESNSAAWWYVNAAELGRHKRSLAECRANYPFCFVDTRHLVALLDVPAVKPS